MAAPEGGQLKEWTPPCCRALRVSDQATSCCVGGHRRHTSQQLITSHHLLAAMLNLPEQLWQL